MELTSLTIKNFRSITTASRVPLAASTVLLGANNEGKSNVLRALVLSMKAVLGQRVRAMRRGYTGLDDGFDWERDFPRPMQQTAPNGESVFNLEFKLSADEEEAFWDEVKSN